MFDLLRDLWESFKLLVGSSTSSTKIAMTVEEKLALLQKEADEAEKLAVAAEQAADLRKKTAAARVRYQKALATSGATKKGRFTKSQMLMFIVVFIIFIFIMYSCMH